MRFFLTDDRTWYQQAVSGVYHALYFLCFIIIAVTLILVIGNGVPALLGISWFEIFVWCILTETLLVILEWCMT